MCVCVGVYVQRAAKGVRKILQGTSSEHDAWQGSNRLCRPDVFSNGALCYGRNHLCRQVAFPSGCFVSLANRLKLRVVVLHHAFVGVSAEAARNIARHRSERHRTQCDTCPWH